MDTATPKSRPVVIVSLDGDFSQLPQTEVNKILQEWQRERVLGIPAKKRLRTLLGVLKGERLWGAISND